MKPPPSGYWTIAPGQPLTPAPDPKGAETLPQWQRRLTLNNEAAYSRLANNSEQAVPDLLGRDCEGSFMPREARRTETDPERGRTVTALATIPTLTDADYLALAYQQAAETSDDPATKNGSVLASLHGEIEGYGSNHFPPGIAVTPERLERPLKYDYILHAEETACVDAGHKARGGTLYCPWYACTSCAKTIIAHGVARVVGHDAVKVFGEQHSPGWTESIRLALEMLSEAGVQCHWHSGPVPNAPSIIIGGHTFDPTQP